MELLKEYMLIGEAAKFLGLSRETLRNWDLKGKLPPCGILRKTGYRFYSVKKLEKKKEYLREAR